MQRGRAGFLRTGENEIEPLDFAPSASKHRHESRAAKRVAQSGSREQDVVDLFL